MSNREKVIYDIERCICHVPDACRDCSKYKGVDGLRCMEELMTDALALLKEQENIEGQIDYQRASDMRDYCEHWESTYNPEDGSM